LYRSGAVVVREQPDGSECVKKWDAAVPLPAFDELPPLAEARLVLDTPAHDRVFENGKWRVKTPAERSQIPSSKRAVKREAARTALVAELQSAGFTNATFSVDDVRDWVDVATLNAAQEKRVTRLLDKFVTLSREPLDIVK
jgi:hypothetical protein